MVVVDDASTDETAQVCKSFKDVRVIRLERNLYLGGARNTGIRASTGKYLAFLDDDDRRLPGSLDAQLEVLQANPDASFIYGPAFYGDTERCEQTGAVIAAPHAGDIFWQLVNSNFIYVNTVLARRDCVEEVGLFDESLRGLEDWYMWTRLAERHQVLRSAEPVGIYRMPVRGSNQMSADRLAMCRLSALAQARMLQLPRAKSATRQRRRRIRKTFLNSLTKELASEARLAFTQRRFRKASEYVSTALQLDAVGIVTPRNLMRISRRVFKLGGVVLNKQHQPTIKPQ